MFCLSQSNHWREHCVDMTILPFPFKTSLAIFKFMKVELKYWRFMNSNDPIFKTDLASLKYPGIQNQWLLNNKIFNDTQSSRKLLMTKCKDIHIIIKIN